MHLLSPKGFQAAGVYAGIKSARKPDIALLACETAASAAAMFTTNKVVAAPVTIAQRNLRSSGARIRAIVVNAGNANACTGTRGIRDARSMCSLVASRIGCSAAQVLPCSTGIIGHPLPMTRVHRGIELVAKSLGASPRHADQFADAILTTDTKRKTAATRFRVGRSQATIAGVCKGSGMIGPRLGAPHATMLAFLTTDAVVSPAQLGRLLRPVVDRSFNAVTVDDHASTNDAVILLASGRSNAKINSFAAARSFLSALSDVCQSLAYQIAADGEGATKVVRIMVEGARNESEAKMVARAIANSPLVKCAMNGNDPNWGRIVSAAGYCGAAFDPDRATLSLQTTRVFHRGQPARFDAGRVSRGLRAKQVDVTLSCGLGPGRATIWTCDLSRDYVTINADYHT